MMVSLRWLKLNQQKSTLVKSKESIKRIIRKTTFVQFKYTNYVHWNFIFLQAK